MSDSSDSSSLVSLDLSQTLNKESKLDMADDNMAVDDSSREDDSGLLSSKGVSQPKE